MPCHDIQRRVTNWCFPQITAKLGRKLKSPSRSSNPATGVRKSLGLAGRLNQSGPNLEASERIHSFQDNIPGWVHPGGPLELCTARDDRNFIRRHVHCPQFSEKPEPAPAEAQTTFRRPHYKNTGPPWNCSQYTDEWPVPSYCHPRHPSVLSVPQ